MHVIRLDTIQHQWTKVSAVVAKDDHPAMVHNRWHHDVITYTCQKDQEFNAVRTSSTYDQSGLAHRVADKVRQQMVHYQNIRVKLGSSRNLSLTMIIIKL